MADLSLSRCSCSALSLIVLLCIYSISVAEGRSMPDPYGGLADLNIPEWEVVLKYWCRNLDDVPSICSVFNTPPTWQPPVGCEVKQRCQPAPKERPVKIPDCEPRTITVNKCKGRCCSELKLIPYHVSSAKMPAPGLSDFMDTRKPSCCVAIDHKPMMVTLKCKKGPIAVTVANPTQCQCS